MQETSVQLGQERGRAEHLQRTVHQLEAEGRESAERIAQLSASEKELADTAREQVGTFLSIFSLHYGSPCDPFQEREIQLLTGSNDDLRAQAEDAQRKVRELEEQIQSDDRAERLEATLQHTQDHAADLELQVSKLKQVRARHPLRRNVNADQRS